MSIFKLSSFKIAVLAGIFMWFCANQSAMAQYGGQTYSYSPYFDPTKPNVIISPPQSNPTQGLPPPPGSGSTPPTVTPGDQTASPPVPTGWRLTAPSTGNVFPNQDEQPRPRINLLVDEGTATVSGISADRGTRVALTFQPDQLTSSQRGQIQSAGMSNLFTNMPYQNVVVTTAQLKKIQDILNPYPNSQQGTPPYRGTPDSNITSRLATARQSTYYIATDSPAQGYPRYSSSGVYPSDLGIRRFSKYLIIKGAVVACIEIVIAGAFMVFGHQYAGNKAIVAAVGLIWLLMSFTIWKIDYTNFYNARGLQMNANNPDSYDVDVVGQPGNPPLSPQEQITGSHTYTGDNTLSQDTKTSSASASLPQANLPVVPSITTSSTPRSGLPLLPLGSQH